jgi:hypothetical protein
MSWEGKPKWSGEYASFGEVTGKLFPVMGVEPFVIAIEGSDDVFFMLFSDEEKLRETSTKFLKKLGESENLLSVGRVTSDEFVDSMISMGIRLMCDPVIIDDHHTKWVEIVRQGDVYKYVDAQTN